MKPIYLDYNATTPIDVRVREAMLPFLDNYFGNPSSTHWYGVQSKLALEKARRQVAEFLGCEPDEIYFTSGGSESNNLAIKGVAFAQGRQSGHIITTRIEHPAVLEVCEFLRKRGFDVTFVGVDEFGRVAAEEIERAIRPDTVLISVMHANNEIGTVQPIKEIARTAAAYGVLLHSDAAQSAGKIPVQVRELGVDLLSIAGHKLYAPKGIGVLYVRRSVTLEKLIHGASHERNLRAGTENVLEIVGLGAACELAGRELSKRQEWTAARAAQLSNGLTERLSGIRINGHPTHCLPNTVSVSFYGLDANTILSELRDIAASPGAACHAAGTEISHVLTAIGLKPEWSLGTIRFSVGAPTTKEEIEHAVDQVVATVGRLRGRDLSTVQAVSADVKLTQFTHGLGCACKLRPQLLEEVLSMLPKPTHPAVLVGAESSDDAAVYRLDDQTAIVQTVDFFTPIVDDPYEFGAIAAANAFSDIYAMGGRPLFALNIVAFPSQRLSMSVLEAILRGASDKAKEAGIVIIGGHTIDDLEPKYGLATTGVVSPQKIWRNIGARVGDALVLTKALGTGIISTAVKRGLADASAASAAVETMSALNKTAAETAADFEIHACTDITGFGLLGHLLEMVRGSAVAAVIDGDRIEPLAQALELAAAGAVPGGTQSNLDHVAGSVVFDARISPFQRILLADAQTSGGLLFAVAPQDADKLTAALTHRRVTANIIGEIVTLMQKPYITVR